MCVPCYFVIQVPDFGDDDDFCESSLTAVANKSLDMSRSLTEKCVQLADLQLADETGPLLSNSANCSPSSGVGKDQNCQCVNETIMVGFCSLSK